MFVGLSGRTGTPDPGHSSSVVLLPLAVKLSTHTHTAPLGYGAGSRESLHPHTLKFTRKSELRPHHQEGPSKGGLPAAELCCLSLPGPRLHQVTDSCPPHRVTFVRSLSGLAGCRHDDDDDDGDASLPLPVDVL